MKTDRERMNGQNKKSMQQINEYKSEIDKLNKQIKALSDKVSSLN